MGQTLRQSAAQTVITTGRARAITWSGCPSPATAGQGTQCIGKTVTTNASATGRVSAGSRCPYLGPKGPIVVMSLRRSVVMCHTMSVTRS